MSLSLERFWVSLLDSDRFRRFAKYGPGSVLFRNWAYQKLNLARRYLTTAYLTWRVPGYFEDVRTYCMFIGHNKSGTTLIGSLLDAHPNVILADEVDALQYVQAGFKRDQIFHLLLKTSRRELMKGRVTARRLQAYSFLVPGQWQGRFRRLQVIGDSTSGSSTRRLGTSPDLLDRLHRLMNGVEVKFIQVVRNPFDPIAVSMVRGNRTFEEAVEHYFSKCEFLVDIRKRLAGSSLLVVRYEDFIADPAAGLKSICAFLGIEAEPGYLSACTAVLHKNPVQDRRLIEWTPDPIRLVQEKIGQYDFLAGYAFDDASPAPDPAVPLAEVR
jgi:hypothetical protein